jgi:YD repeat-containing protein
VIDQNSNKTSYAYDDADRLISVTDAQTPTAGVTGYVYDTQNNLTDIYVAAQNHTHFGPYQGDKVVQITFPSGLIQTYIWDNEGNLEEVRDRLVNTIAYYYDFQNRVMKKLSLWSPPGGGEP